MKTWNTTLLSDLPFEVLDDPSSWLASEIRKISDHALKPGEAVRTLVNDYECWDESIQDFLDSFDIINIGEYAHMAESLEECLDYAKPHDVLIATLGATRTRCRFVESDEVLEKFSENLIMFKRRASYRLTEIRDHLKECGFSGGKPNWEDIDVWELSGFNDSGQQAEGSRVRIYCGYPLKNM